MVPWPNVLSSLFQRKQTPQAINLHLLFPRLCSPESMSKYKICLLNMMRPSPPPDIFAVSCEVMWGTSWVCRRGGVCVCVCGTVSLLTRLMTAPQCVHAGQTQALGPAS